MSTMKEMAAEYRQAAAKLAMSIKRHQELGDKTPYEIQQMREALHDIREAGYMMSEYYEAPRAENGLTIHGMKAGRNSQ